MDDGLVAYRAVIGSFAMNLPINLLKLLAEKCILFLDIIAILDVARMRGVCYCWLLACYNFCC